MTDYEDEGLPVDIEDIAIVVWDARRAYRITQGGGSQVAWMHAPEAEKKAMVRTIQGIIGAPDEPPAEDDPEDKLIVAIVRALAP